MPNYIVNKNAQYDTRDHEVHVTPRSSCSSPRYPEPQNQETLGYYSTCNGAVRGQNPGGTRRMAVTTVQTPAIPADANEEDVRLNRLLSDPYTLDCKGEP